MRGEDSDYARLSQPEGRPTTVRLIAGAIRYCWARLCFLDGAWVILYAERQRGWIMDEDCRGSTCACGVSPLGLGRSAHG
jgi:hypothetical protein